MFDIFVKSSGNKRKYFLKDLAGVQFALVFSLFPPVSTEKIETLEVRVKRVFWQVSMPLASVR